MISLLCFAIYFKIIRTIYLILLMLLQSTILQQIATKNLVKITISQVQLQNNFQAILKALRFHDSAISDLMSKVNSFENASKKQENKHETRQKDHDGKKVTTHHDQLLKKLVDQSMNKDQQLKRLSSNVDDLKEKMDLLQALTKEMNEKINKNQQDIEKGHNENQKMKDSIGLTNQRLDKVEAKANAHDQYEQRIVKLENQLNEQINKINKLDQTVKQIDTLNKSNKGKESNNQQLSNESIDKLMKQLESKFNQKINEHKKASQDEFEKVYGMFNDINKNQIQKINSTLDDHSKNFKKLSQDIWKLNEQLYKHQSQTPQTLILSEMDTKRIAELQRKVEELKEAMKHLNNESSHFGKNYSTTLKTPQKTEQPEWSPSPNKQILTSRERQQIKDINQIKEESMDQKINFKKQIIDKLKQQKGDFNKALKKLDNFNLKKEESKQKIGSIQQKILRIEHILDGKIDEEGMKKWMRYIQNKVNYLYRIVNVQSPEEDACIARKNWICLSCDKNLDAYKGKVGNHLISAQLKGKTIEQDVVGGGMLFRSKSRYEMPSVKK